MFSFISTTLATVVGLIVVSFVVRPLYSLHHHLRTARSSNLPYIVVPVFFWNKLWRALYIPVLASLRLILPKSWISLRLELTHPDFAYNLGWQLHEELGESFIIVTPETNFLCTAEPEVISQICAERDKFPKPIEIYEMTNIYGKNVVTMEGSDWRRHRKVVGVLGEKSVRGVWKESLFQSSQMVEYWKREAVAEQDMAKIHVEKEEAGLSVKDLARDTMRLSLYVISRAGFNVRCIWPGGKNENQGESEGLMDATEVKGNHKMSYMASLETLLHSLVAVISLPMWLLELVPIKSAREAALAYHEWGSYMSEIYSDRVNNSSKDSNLDLMGSMVRASKAATTGAGLSKSEILGNSFIFFLAGHETAANTIYFALLHLAMRPGFQRRLQTELDQLLGKKPNHDDWEYDEDLPLLFGGLLGATMNETLRLLSPVQMIPKRTTTPQPIALSDGRQVVIPGNTIMGLNANAVHRNPRVWPHDDREDGIRDIDDFKPERWLLKKSKRKEMEFSFVHIEGEEALDTSPDTAETLFKPPKGAYIPFSEGPRACLGRRFAQVEILAVLAVLLRDFSFELDVETDVSGLQGSDKRKVWEAAKNDVNQKLRDEMLSIITIQLRGKPVKFRVVKRGQEVFTWDD